MSILYKGIIIFGTMGSGKDTLADLLTKRIFCPKIYKLGEDIRKIVDNASPEGDNRKLYQDYGQAVRQTLGKDAWNYICKHKIQRDQAECSLLFPIIADGRQINEADYWCQQGFCIIGLDTLIEKRYERLVKRDGSCDKSRMTHDTELQAQFIATQLCDYKINNDGSLDNLKSEADKIAQIVKY